MDIKYSLLHVSDPPEKWIKQTKKFLLVTKYKREVEIAAQSQLIPNPCLVLSHYSCQHTAVYPHMFQFQRGRIQPKKNLAEVVTDSEISLLYLSIIYLWFLHLHDIYGTTEVKKSKQRPLVLHGFHSHGSTQWCLWVILVPMWHLS